MASFVVPARGQGTQKCAARTLKSARQTVIIKTTPGSEMNILVVCIAFTLNEENIMSKRTVIGIMGFVATITLIWMGVHSPAQGMDMRRPGETFQAADFGKLSGMEGFSDTLLQNHFKLYQGYVKNTNALAEKLGSMLKEGKTDTPEYAELKRRFGFEFNGMRLHEYYFGNLGGRKDLDQASPLYATLVREYGSYAQWKKDFIATGLMRGIGWVVLYKDTQTGRLFNCWVNEHEVNHLAGCKPLLVMDVFEHAYMTDYQLDRARYIEAFFKNVNWEAVAKRFP
jgi:superoxide dismutase, Fe-Mn family